MRDFPGLLRAQGILRVATGDHDPLFLSITSVQPPNVERTPFSILVNEAASGFFGPEPKPALRMTSDLLSGRSRGLCGLPRCTTMRQNSSVEGDDFRGGLWCAGAEARLIEDQYGTSKLMPCYKSRPQISVVACRAAPHKEGV